MPDVLTREQRHLNMSRIRAKDTKPEMLVRRGLHARGYRYRLHHRELAGRPDLVFPCHKAVIFVHGCFWHRHECHLFRVPKTRRTFWRKKLSGNCNRDRKSFEALRREGWRVLIVWECALRGTEKMEWDSLLKRMESFLKGSRGMREIKGTKLDSNQS
jgi:DNA mismatch endonuclease, patch repair protein